VGPRTLPRYHDPVAALPVVSAAPDVVYLAGLLLFRGCGLRFMLLLLLFQCNSGGMVAGCGMEEAQGSGRVYVLGRRMVVGDHDGVAVLSTAAQCVEAASESF
jgi:hypothetical protein